MNPFSVLLTSLLMGIVLFGAVILVAWFYWSSHRKTLEARCLDLYGTAQNVVPYPFAHDETSSHRRRTSVAGFLRRNDQSCSPRPIRCGPKRAATETLNRSD